MLTSPTLADALVPNRSALRDALMVLGGSIFIAALSQVSIPMQPVPLTGQTLGVFLVALALGSRLGGLSVATYLLEGLVGLPVLAGFSGGIAKFTGPTGGYLIGFLLAAIVVGYLAERGWTRSVLLALAAMFVGTILIYIPGLAWLSKFVGADTIKFGLSPFLIGDSIKAAIAAAALPGLWKLLGK